MRRPPRRLTLAILVVSGLVACAPPVSDGGEVHMLAPDSATPAPASPPPSDPDATGGAGDAHDTAAGADASAGGPFATATTGPDATQDAATATTPDPEAAADADPAATRLFVRVEFDTIDDAELAALRALPGVARVAAPRRDDGALWSSRRADGTPVDALPDGFKISVALEVDHPELPVHPAAGEVVLTAAGAVQRDLDVGSTVVLTDRVERTVVAVSDAPELQDVEFVVATADATALDVRERQRGLVVLDGTADPDTVAAGIRDVLGDDAHVQPRSPDDRPYVLSLPATKARFGEFAHRDLDGRDIQAGVSWIEEYIVDAEVPVIGRVVCNRLIIDDLTSALLDIVAAGLAHELDPDLYGGCWAPRRINRNANLSRHAWGIAIDLNVDFDAPGMGPIPSPGVIEAFERHGFRWGGDYPIPDNHHFEWVGHDED